MRAIICGGRKFEDRVGGFAFLNEIHSGTPISFVIEGGAVGGDRIGREWAIKNNIPYYTYEPDWDGLGPKAGPLRNKQMLVEGKPDVVLALPGAKGTAHMVRIAEEANVKVIALNLP